MTICIMWGEKVEKRGLFERIFGKGTPQKTGLTQYQLLNSSQFSFSTFSGNPYDVSIVRASVDSFARRAARVKPRHIRRVGGAITEIDGSKISRILQTQPNPYTTAYQFLYRVATQYKLYNNAFIYPVWNQSNGALEALYNVNANSIELLQSPDNEMYVRMSFNNGNRYVCPFTDLIYVGRHFNGHDVFGDGNNALRPVLETANTFNESMSAFAKLVAVVRGILKIKGMPKDADLRAARDKFVTDNLSIDENGAGIIVSDDKSEYVPVSDKSTPIPKAQLDFIKSEIHDYFGTNEDIIQNKATPEQEDSFFEGEIEPFYIQLEQALTNGIFWGKELGFGNEIICEGNRLQYAKLAEKTAAIQFIAGTGALSVDQILTLYNLPPIGGDEGKRRIQTLNNVNADKADKYQGVE